MKNLYYNTALFISQYAMIWNIQSALEEINYRHLEKQSLVHFYSIVDLFRDKNSELDELTVKFDYDEWIYVLEWAQDLQKLPLSRIKDLGL